MVKIARGLLYFVVPGELLLVVLLVAGVAPPRPVLVAAEIVVLLVLALEAVTAYRLFRAGRRAGATRRAALTATVDQMVPGPVRLVVLFELKGMASLLLWIARRRHGVPRGAIAVSYVKEQATMTLLMLFAMVVEAVAVDLILVAMDAPGPVRFTLLAIDVYGILFGLAFAAACATRPHVVTPGELRVRYAAYFDARVPMALIASVRQARNLNENSMVRVADGRLSVVVGSQTNVVVELTEPVTVTRPLGRQAEVHTIRFFADDPAAAVRALRGAAERPASAAAH
ncbi:hypothetical protein [Spongiactinospora sp. TRM90649]|uniref:hypothetical protein n=1 Tax=Spongiactinospora sp. TRM90649 TaxID=3031114 RepID=UPI0023F9D541|nr:hypothetical protein [Spongiactinospora sp. TRM90649]MDF5756052.1 hypothetical protein [Spongiactinospora sp. TRM90649]